MTVRCCGCNLPIADRFLLKVIDRTWHLECLRCVICRRVLSDKCFRRQGLLYCPSDFYRRFGTKCVSCCHGFAPGDLVREVQGRLFHVECFSCVVCGRKMKTGQEVLVIDDATILCKEDFLHGRMTTGQSDECSRIIFASDSPDTRFPADQQRTSLVTDQQRTSLATDQQRTSLVTDQKRTSLATDSAKGTIVEMDSQGTSIVNRDSQGTSVKSKAQGASLKMDSASENCETTDSEADLDIPVRTEPDVDLGEQGGPRASAKRRGPRTTIRVQQLELLKEAFARNPKPMAAERESIRQMTGLDMKVIQVWFQNRRSKERRRKLLHNVSSFRHLVHELIDRQWSTLLPFDLNDKETETCEPRFEPERSYLNYDDRTAEDAYKFFFRGNSMHYSFEPEKMPLTSSTTDAFEGLPASVAALEMPSLSRDAADCDASSWTSL